MARLLNKEPIDSTPVNFVVLMICDQLPLRCLSSTQRNYGVCSSSPIVIYRSSGGYGVKKNRRLCSVVVKQEKRDSTEIPVPVPLTLEQQEKEKKQSRDDEEEEGEVDPEDLKYVGEIKRVLELLRRNRDMLFTEDGDKFEVSSGSPLPGMNPLQLDESMRLPKETIDILRDQVFVFDTFFVL